MIEVLGFDKRCNDAGGRPAGRKETPHRNGEIDINDARRLKCIIGEGLALNVSASGLLGNAASSVNRRVAVC